MLQLGHLAQKIYGKEYVEVSAPEVALILEACKELSILVYTQLRDLLDEGGVKELETKNGRESAVENA